MSQENTIPEPPKDFPPMSQWSFVFEKAHQWLSLLDFKNISSLKIGTYSQLTDYLKRRSPEKFGHLDIHLTGDDGYHDFDGQGSDSSPMDNFVAGRVFCLIIRLIDENWSVDFRMDFYVNNTVGYYCLGENDIKWGEVIDQKLPKILNKDMTWEDGFFFLKKFYEETVIDI
jgi:hypothetical protein